MCRVAVRQASTRAHRQAQEENVVDSSNGSVQGNGGQEYFDVDALFGDLDQSCADADFAFMQYLNSGIVPQGTTAQDQGLNVVQGQPVGYPSQQPAAVPGSYVQPVLMMPTQQSPEFVDHHSINNNYMAGYQVQQQLANPGMLQEESIAAEEDATEKPAKKTRAKRKTKKTPEEIAEQVERVKRRRRESAHRSRQKRFAYIKNLETENQALKMENERLRQMLSSSKTSVAKDDGSMDSREKEDVMYSKSELAASSNALIDSTFNDIMCKANAHDISTAADILGITSER